MKKKEYNPLTSVLSSWRHTTAAFAGGRVSVQVVSVRAVSVCGLYVQGSPCLEGRGFCLERKEFLSGGGFCLWVSVRGISVIETYTSPHLTE